MTVGAGQLTLRITGAALALLLGVSAAHGQASGPIKNAVSNPCQFDAGLGRSGRCASAGDTVSWVIYVQNPSPTNQLFGVRDPATTPAGCSTFTCPPTLLVNGTPTALPPGATCDPATGFDIQGIDVPGNGWFEVDYQSVLSATLTPGDSCSNLATIVYPWADVPTSDPVIACQVDSGGGVFPTKIDICGGSTGTPDLKLIKTAETPAGAPMANIEDGAQVCWRFRIENAGTVPAMVDFTDFFDSHLSALDFDPADPFATGNCAWGGNQVGCGGIIIAPGASDEARICGTFACTNGQADLCNAASLTIQDPPTGTTVASQPCETCGTGSTCLTVLAPDFMASAKTATYTDTNRSGCLDQGDSVAFELTAINGGTARGADVQFFDVDPPEGTYAGDCTWSVGGGAFQPCPAPPNTGWSLGAMVPGDRPIVIRWSVVLSSPIPSGADWCDQGGTLVAAECDASRVMGDTCLPGCAAGPDVQSTILCVPGALMPGEETTVTLIACNEGAVPATNVVLTNPIQPCSTYVAGSMTIAVGGGPATAVTDAPDGDGGTSSTAPDQLAFALQDFMGRALQPGECVNLSFRLRGTTCVDPGFMDIATITGDGMAPHQSSGCFVQILQPRSAPYVWKVATPDPEVGPGDLITYTLRTCNDDTATDDAVNVVVTDEVPACTDYEPGTLRIDGRLVTDAAGDDAADYAPPGAGAGMVTFRVPRLAPGECTELTWQARAQMMCGGTFVLNRAYFGADGVAGPLASNETQTAVSTYSLQKTGADVDGGRLVAGDEVEYSIRFCSGSPRDLLQVDVTDLIPTMTGVPASACPVTYVPESMTVQVDGQAETPLTDQILDDLGHFDPGPPAFIEIIVSPLSRATCFTARFRVRLDLSCVPGDCIGNRAHAQYTTPLEQIDSNTELTCTGASLTGQLMRAVGRASLVPTGGCQFGPRLLDFGCSEIPGICREDVPGVRWTMLRDAMTLGNALTFYEMPGSGCCVAAPPDGAHLAVRKEFGTDDLVVEIVNGCP